MMLKVLQSTSATWSAIDAEPVSPSLPTGDS